MKTRFMLYNIRLYLKGIREETGGISSYYYSKQSSDCGFVIPNVCP